MSNKKLKPLHYDGVTQSLYLKRQSKSWEAFQQSVLMGILARNGYVFKVSIPEKYSNKVSHLFKIISMERGGIVNKMDEYIRCECKKLCDRESQTVSDVTQLKRHSDKNRISMGLNILLKEAEAHGYSVRRRGTRGSKYTVIAEKFTEIYYKDTIWFDKSNIRVVGKLINDYLTKKCKSIDRKTLLLFGAQDLLEIMNSDTGDFHDFSLLYFPTDHQTPSAFSKRLIFF
ncbi:TATA-binding protein-associated phosphoprotein [Entamoeba marina]